jgi:hypothetical protein
MVSESYQMKISTSGKQIVIKPKFNKIKDLFNLISQIYDKNEIKIVLSELNPGADKLKKDTYYSLLTKDELMVYMDNAINLKDWNEVKKIRKFL